MGTKTAETRLDWWSQPGSNRRPLQCHCSALPAELWPRLLFLVVAGPDLDLFDRVLAQLGRILDQRRAVILAGVRRQLGLFRIDRHVLEFGHRRRHLGDRLAQFLDHARPRPARFQQRLWVVSRPARGTSRGLLAEIVIARAAARTDALDPPISLT